jgi:hypothetical protein
MATSPTPQSTSVGPSGGTGSDTLDNHSHPAGTMPRQEPLYNPFNVYANGVEIALYNAATVPGTFTDTTVPRVTVAAAIQNVDGDDGNTAGKVEADRFLAEGRITTEEHKKITTTASPKTPGVGPSAPVPSRSSAAVPGNITLATVLTPNGTTLATMIKNVSFPRTIQQLADHNSTVSGAQNVVNNLAALALNCLEPIKAKYPNVQITNSFRQGEVSNGQKIPDRGQHGSGQAMDLQFRGVPAHSYFDIAVWISKNIPYDQLLLEYKVGSTVWIHVSFAAPGLPFGGISVRKSKGVASTLATLNGASGGKFTPNLHADIIQGALTNKVVLG